MSQETTHRVLRSQANQRCMMRDVTVRIVSVLKISVSLLGHVLLTYFLIPYPFVTVAYHMTLNEISYKNLNR